MTFLYYDSIFQEHHTGNHPENGGRTLTVIRHLNFIALDTSCRRPTWDAVSLDRLCYVHTREYLEQLQRFAAHGGGQIEADTVVGRKSFEVACMAVGAVCDAVQRVIQGEDRNAFCLIRPPGHHAMPDHAMGFCLLNNVAVGASLARRELGVERVLIVDFDVHHGNGTQAMFWEDANVGYFSMHRSPFYPGTGGANEMGAGPGWGTTRNLPIAWGTSPADQLSWFDQQLKEFAAKIKPQLVLVSAGFDSHKNDPIGSLGLESQDFRAITRSLLEVANQYAGNKLVSVLEGGYHPDALADCISIHLEELLADP